MGAWFLPGAGKAQDAKASTPEDPMAQAERKNEGRLYRGTLLEPVFPFRGAVPWAARKAASGVSGFLTCRRTVRNGANVANPPVPHGGLLRWMA